MTVIGFHASHEQVHPAELLRAVVAIGRASLVEDPDELHDIRTHMDPTPWAGGRRHLYIRLVWRDLTGRRIGADWTRTSMTPVRRAAL